MNDDSRFGPEPREQLTQPRPRHGDASFGRGEPRPGHMDEHRAAAPGHARPGVVINFDNKIIELIIAPEPVAGASGRDFDMPVVAPISRVLAPGVAGTDRAR